MRDFNEMDARGRSLLYVAARAADPAAVKRALILVNAETASARTASGKTALFAAARGGCREIVEILAKRADADPNARANDGRTALWTACYHGHVEAARVLVQHGADPSIPDASGRTPLLAACATGAGTCARLLLSGACDMPRRVDAEVKEASAGCSPLFAACVDPQEAALFDVPYVNVRHAWLPWMRIRIHLQRMRHLERTFATCVVTHLFVLIAGLVVAAGLACARIYTSPYQVHPLYRVFTFTSPRLTHFTVHLPVPSPCLTHVYPLYRRRTSTPRPRRVWARRSC